MANLIHMPALISLRSVFRTLMLGLLMAGVLVKPVIAIAGAVHEAEHSSLSGDHGQHDNLSSEPIDSSDTTNPWHALVHFSHCCGQAPVLLSLIYLGSITPAASDPLPLLSFELPPAVHPVAFRPPIST